MQSSQSCWDDSTAVFIGYYYSQRLHWEEQKLSKQQKVWCDHFFEGPSNWEVAGEKSDPLQSNSQLFDQSINTECSNLYLNPLRGLKAFVSQDSRKVTEIIKTSQNFKDLHKKLWLSGGNTTLAGPRWVWVNFLSGIRCNLAIDKQTAGNGCGCSRRWILTKHGAANQLGRL